MKRPPVGPPHGWSLGRLVPATAPRSNRFEQMSTVCCTYYFTAASGRRDARCTVYMGRFIRCNHTRKKTVCRFHTRCTPGRCMGLSTGACTLFENNGNTTLLPRYLGRPTSRPLEPHPLTCYGWARSPAAYWSPAFSTATHG